MTHGQQPCTVVSACLFLYFNCYIFPVLIWAKRAASAESGTSKDTSPSLTSCLSLWRGPGFEMLGKGTGKAVWIPGWNEFDGLIVAPSGHRRSPQRASWAGNRTTDKERQQLENAPASSRLHLGISPRGSPFDLTILRCVFECQNYLWHTVSFNCSFNNSAANFRLLQTWQFPEGDLHSFVFFSQACSFSYAFLRYSCRPNLLRRSLTIITFSWRLCT